MPAGTTTVLDAGPDVLDALRDVLDAGPDVLDATDLEAAADLDAGALDLVVPLVAATETATCVCGHGQDAHEHYRRGNDCALCDCPRYRRRR